MAKKLYVGNLNYDIDADHLTEWFSAYGTVEHAHIVKDRETDKSRGYGFVEMSTEEEAQAAVEGLNGADKGGRELKVAEANPPKAKPQRGGGRRFGGGGGGGGHRGGPRGGSGGGGGGGRRFGSGGGGNREGGGGNREGGPRRPRY